MEIAMGKHMDSNKNDLRTISGRRFMRLAEVKHQVGLGRTAIYDGVKQGTFPAPVSLGARAVAWLSDEIAGWMESRVQASRNQQNES